MKPKVLIVFLLLFTSSLFAQHAATPPRANSSFLPVSVWYAGGKTRAPMLEPVTADSEKAWRADLQKIKSLGFNTVRTWIEWSANEPKPGEYHFEQLDLMLKLAEEAGLKVMIQVYVDSAPDWVGEKFPDGRFVAQNGQAITSQAAPGYCFDHPGVRQAILNYYREAARHAEKSPAFFGWDLWSEPHVINWAEITYIPHAQFCFCPYSLARFREWLRGKYGTLDALNQAWHREFHDWSQVEPPRFDTILSYTDYIDWRVFTTDKLAQDLQFRNAAVKEIGPTHVTTSHSAVPGVFTSLGDGDGNPDDWLMYRSVDYYGVSLYPKHSLPPHWSLQRRALAMDFTRSASGNKGFYVGELQGGFGVRGDVVSQPITSDDLREYMWGAIARGARGINIYAFYPMSSGYESGGYGLIDLDGQLTERSKVAGETARQIAANADLLTAAHPQQPEVAILFNHLTTLIGGAAHIYNPAALRDSSAGYHRMFFERNIPVDFVSAREFDPALLAKYKLIVAPYPILMMANVASALEKYVQGGGHLFVEARPGWVDERGFAQPVVPGFGWEKMFGVRERAVTPKPETKILWTATQSGTPSLTPVPIEFTGARFEERFEVMDPTARPLATFDDGTAAAFQHDYGKGSAVILGTFAGQINETKPQAMHPLGDFLTQWAGLTKPKMEAPAGVEVQRMVSDKGEMLFFFNHSDKPVRVAYAIVAARSVSRISEVAGTLPSAGVGSAALNFEMPAQGVRVYRMDY
jgi:beta-galactosidase